MKKTHEDFLNDLFIKNKKCFDELEFIDKYAGSTSEMIAKNKYGYVITKPNLLLSGRVPTIISSIDKNSYFSEMAKEVHGDKYSYENVKYIKSRIDISVYCKAHKCYFNIRPNNLLQGKGCRKCGENKLSEIFKSTKEDFKQMLKMRDIYGLNIIGEFTNMKTKILVKDNYGEVLMYPNRIGIHKPTILTAINKNKYFANQSIEIHGNLYDYSKVEYIKAKTKVIIICKIHGEFKQTPDNHLQGCGCPICNSSKLELEIRKYLKFNNIDFLEQFKFENCKNIFKLPFDFYLSNKNILIEADGIQHHEPIGFFGGEKQFKKQVTNDNIKNKYCKYNDIKLIRIPYFDIENIDKILSKELDVTNV